jgi:thiamine biosynthesis lipoprotein
MGSAAAVVIVGGSDTVLADVVARVDQLEQRWSRFRPDSEVSRLTAGAGRPVEVGADTIRLVVTAIEAWRESGGAVNPTVLGAVLRAGYDRTLADVFRDPRPADSQLAVVACTDIAIDGSTVTLPAGTGFDPGGIGKGLAADMVVEELLAAGVAGACVSLGGDLRVAGRSPNGEGWTIAIERPDRTDPVALVGLHDGAVATSTTARRRWTIGTTAAHHLIDPDTGRPSTTDLVQVSAIAGRGWLAETHAKAALLRGSARAFDLADDSVALLAVDAGSRVLTTPSLSRFLGDRPLARSLAVTTPGAPTLVSHPAPNTVPVEAAS